MCVAIPIALAAVSAAAAIGGTVYSASAQNKAAQAQINANNQAWNAQFQGTIARTQAQQTYDAAQFAAQTQGLTAEQQIAQQQQREQTGAQQQYQDVVQRTNQQQEQIAQQANQVEQGPGGVTSQISPQSMQAATAARVAAQQGQVAPVVQDVQATNPISDDPTTQAATARAVATAAQNVRTYGGNLAKAGGFTAPLLQGALAQAYGQTGVAPLQSLYQIITNTLPANLAVPTTAYTTAGAEGALGKQVAATATQGALNVGQTAFTNATTLANLEQSDTTQLAQNQAALAQAQGQAAANLGKSLSGLGNLGLYGAGYLNAANAPGLAVNVPGVNAGPAYPNAYAYTPIS